MIHHFADVHTILKESTEEIHHQLHHIPILEKISSGNFDSQDYLDFLCINHRFYHDLETHFAEHSFIPFKDELNFTAWIEKDIDCFDNVLIQNPLHFSELPKDFSSYVGFEYVKYGSMTGSLVLLSKITKAKKIDSNALNFLTKSACNRNRVWPRLLKFIQHNDDSIDIKTAILSAKYCFNLMYQYATESQYGEVV